jgi:hypothetical protein
MVGALEVLLFGGAVFGWPQLVHLLKMDSVFADLCNDVNTAAGPGINKYEAVPQGEIFNNSRCMALNATPVFLPGHKVRFDIFDQFILKEILHCRILCILSHYVT